MKSTTRVPNHHQFLKDCCQRYHTTPHRWISNVPVVPVVASARASRPAAPRSDGCPCWSSGDGKMLPCVFVSGKNILGQWKRWDLQLIGLIGCYNSFWVDVCSFVPCGLVTIRGPVLLWSIQASQDGSVSFLLDDQRPRKNQRRSSRQLQRRTEREKRLDAWCKYPW